MENNNKYNPEEIESKWQKKWAENKAYETPENLKEGKKKYILDMFPYPSGAGLHVGHVESYTATDIYSRYLRMKGFGVLHPQGFDAFGLPAENYAVKTGIHPEETTQKAIQTFKRQIDSMGFSYDWEREVVSSDPGYYKWTQWLFLLLFKNGLAYKKKAKVNWCPKCQTVLANEQAEGGKCERCETEVIQKDLEQWFFKITDFIENDGETAGLLSGLSKVDWPRSTKLLQENWIGKSEGVVIKFKIQNDKSQINSKTQNLKQFIEVFTTRVDTIYGCTYCVVAPEHDFVTSFLKAKSQKSEVKNSIQNFEIKNIDEIAEYVKESKNKTDVERMENQEKTGVEIQGVKVVNPFNGEEVPLFVADFVLGHYGTGAVMAVPAHDERDFEFAKKHGLEIRKVIDDKENISVSDEAFTEYGFLVNSSGYDSLSSEKAKDKMAGWLEKEGIGEKKVNYRLRDWLVSRQRYWGTPIPIVYDPEGKAHPVKKEHLPLELPKDVDFLPTGVSPLASSEEFKKKAEELYGKGWHFEVDTMDTFVCSSWYYLRYADSKNDKQFASKENLKKWLPIDLYVGGAEHSVLHLLYSRFFTKVLHKLGYLDFDEPFLKLRHQGTILAEDGTKMSKSKGNVVNPDDVVKKYGADALRMFEMFMGPLEDAKPWQTDGIKGIYRFLERIYEYLENLKKNNGEEWFNNWKDIKKWGALKNKMQESSDSVKNVLNKTIKKVSEDIENLKFNTAISQLMIFRNSFYKIDQGDKNDLYKSRIETKLSTFITVKDFEKFLILFSPFAPHITEELWEKLGHKQSIFKEKWPEYDENLIQEKEIDLVVQVNGKLRDTIKVRAEISEEEAREKAQKSQKVANYLEGKTIKKTIFVPGKLINFVV